MPNGTCNVVLMGNYIVPVTVGSFEMDDTANIKQYTFLAPTHRNKLV